MYAVVEIGGHQYKVSEGDVLFVDKQADEAGGTLTFDRVLLINNDNGDVEIGQPVVDGAQIEATLVDNVKSDKVIVFKKKRRKGYRVKRGHRQPMSQIEINSISTSGNGAAKKSKASESPGKEKDETTTKTSSQVSTDMTAKEAISHIRNTPLEELEGFVPEDEDRVTVQDAWESKQEG